MQINQTKTAVAGNKGKGIKSDCFVEFTLQDKAGIIINLNSKVKPLFGKQIHAIITDVCAFYDIDNAIITIEDTGALDYVIAARLEHCIKQVIKTEKEYLLPKKPYTQYGTQKQRMRFSRLYLPGNTPKLALNAGIHKPNGIILDLEDSVAPEKKAEATLLVRNALRQVNFYGAERMVRINQLPQGVDDLKYIIPHNIHVILLPKCESKNDIITVNQEIEKIKQKNKIIDTVYLMPIIESALGVVNAYEIAASANNVVALAIGLEDYTADIGAKRTQVATESFYARTQLVNSCKAAGIQAIDSVFSDVADMEALLENVKTSKSLGFEGMGCIHPRQINVIHKGFAPDENDIEKAKKIVNAFIEATEKGLGVVSLGSKMIDPPVVKRAQQTIDIAINLGLLEKNWRNNND